MVAAQIRWFFLWWIIGVVISVNRLCFRCNGVSSMRLCNTTATCGDNEECYLERVTKSDLQVIFSAGCRSKTVCQIMATLSGNPRRRDLVNCAQCCVNPPGASEPCNSRLCGQQPLVTTVSPSAVPGLKCMSCHHALSVHECKKTTVDCQHHEECYFESVTTSDRKVKFNAGCRSRAVCNLMSSLGPKIGKRDLVNCAECCSGPPDREGPCNTRLCGESSAPRCLVCNGLQSSRADCQTSAICPQNQTCYNGVRIVGSSSLQYVYGCEEEQTCQAFAENYHHYHNNQHVGRSVSNDGGVIVCDSCCKDDMCNAQDCFALLKKISAYKSWCLI
ncbi:uncharacterized protein LOC134271202 isoform X2 [Saccostrea cucullata]|uniref:uncharacterized protein LOC134271202 isoform X2 n=1 Tax=Saccostrea cuccullata TaxID=36930 RepID=UPI002ECFF1EE